MRAMILGAILAVALTTSAMAQGGGQGASGALASVDGKAISSADVDKTIAADLAKLEGQIYELKKSSLNTLIDEQLLAQEASKRGITAAALLQAEVTSKSSTATDEEVAVYYGANQAKLQKDLGAWRDQIRAFLNLQKASARRTVFLEQLRAQHKVDVFLKAPPIFRAEIVTAGAYAKGPADAPIQLVEFSDFHCPFCKRVEPTLIQVLAKYDGKIRFVYKDFPIDSLHPGARAAAEAARCAGDQGKYWEFHAKLTAGPADSSAPTLQGYAQQVGLDAAQFEACRSSRKYQAPVQTDVAEGTKLGINGTPGFFINGRFLSGAQPLEAFTKIIDEELQSRAARGSR
ncbi:MAG: thioredoxin domain-containing protein [Vicinamibacterales bacterium]